MKKQRFNRPIVLEYVCDSPFLQIHCKNVCLINFCFWYCLVAWLVVGLVISFFVGLGMVEIMTSLSWWLGAWGVGSCGFQGGLRHGDKLVPSGIPYALEWLP